MQFDEEIIALILETLKAQGKSQSALARHLGKDPAQVTRLLKPKRTGDGKPTKKSAELTLREMQQIFQFLGLELSREMLVSRKKVSVKLAPVRGMVAHGVWREREMLVKTNRRDIPFLAVPEFDELEQYAYQVIDRHAEQFVPPDAYILCVQFSEARTQPKRNDIVVIERQSAFSAATRNVIMTERALRKVLIEDGKIVLHALSTDQDVDDISYDPTVPDVKIADLVVGWISLSPNTVM